jgi:hypothetical protein
MKMARKQEDMGRTKTIKMILAVFFLTVILTACGSNGSTATTTPVDEVKSVLPTPVAIFSGNGITWTECVAPYQDYSRTEATTEFAAGCLGMEIPTWDDNDRAMAGDRIEESSGSYLQQVIGEDVYIVRAVYESGDGDYEFLKNGELLIEASAPFTTFEPSRYLWNIGGKVVWELVTDAPVIYVDGVDYNEKYLLDGCYFPYAIHDKLIFIAYQNGKYQVIYAGEPIGHEFDEIYIKYCCAETTILYGGGQYWFWGKRDGAYYVVGIR